MNIFNDPLKMVPRCSDEQTVRTSMELDELSGHKDGLAVDMKSKCNSVRSVPNANRD